MTYWDAIVQVLSAIVGPFPVFVALLLGTIFGVAWAVEKCVDEYAYRQAFRRSGHGYWSLLVPPVLVVLFISLFVLVQANWLGPWSWVPGSADW